MQNSRLRVVVRTSAFLALICASACSAQDSASDGLEAEVAAVRQDLVSPVYGTVTYIGDIPSNKTTEWYQHAQGVAIGLHGGNVNMFYSTNDRLYGREAQSSSQFGISQSMPAAHWEHGMPRALSDLRFNHFGDLDFEHASGADVLLVPLERDDRAFAVVASFIVGDPYMTVFHSYATLSGNNGSAPWVAASKANPSMVYSSAFHPSAIVRYHDSDPGPGLNFDSVTSLPLTTSTYAAMSLESVQGGEFNYSGRLFLIAQGPRPGVYGFELFVAPSSSSFAGRTVFRQFDFYPATLTSGRGEEFEGITVGLIDPPAANDRSQVHVVLNQDGDIFFKHWVVSQAAADFNLR